MDSGHEVTVIRSESESLLTRSPHNFASPVITWQDVRNVTQTLQTSDYTFYHLGNNYHFHEGCLKWMPSFPGIVCLHDFCLTDLAIEACRLEPAKMRDVVSHWYSDEIAADFFKPRKSDSFMEQLRKTAPMTEWLCSQALGILTHSSWGIDRVMSSCPGPVMETPLAYDAMEVPRTDEPHDSTFRIVTLGHINRNKRVHEVIQAIGASQSLRQKAEYWLVGPIEADMRTEVSSLAQKLGVRLVIKGQVNDAEFGNAIQSADVISCLRWPSLEASSASLIEAMLMKKAVIVIDDAHYSDIPDKCVLKISHEREVDELTKAIEELAAQPDARLELGIQAQRYAQSQFSPAAYMNAMIQIATAVASSHPRLAAIDTMTNIAKSWGAHPNLLHAEELIAPLRLFENAPTRQPSLPE
ncbi:MULTISPECIES: glycosyltransferase family 4 protein [Pirellulaceae]|uniref:glycosyltransferase family 4 protein n=1 Tax=Pirellulaceae TaxID=2691357 RepID=UPI001304A531|nr:MULTISPECIES: glycosyltransferase family 4 protein [Pirellulaceae]